MPESGPCQIPWVTLKHTAHFRGETLWIWPLLIAGFVWKGFLRLMTRQRLKRRMDVSVHLRRWSAWGEISTRALRLLLYGLYFFSCVVSSMVVPVEPVRSHHSRATIDLDSQDPKIHYRCSGTRGQREREREEGWFVFHPINTPQMQVCDSQCHHLTCF